MTESIARGTARAAGSGYVRYSELKPASAPAKSQLAGGIGAGQFIVGFYSGASIMNRVHRLAVKLVVASPVRKAAVR